MDLRVPADRPVGGDEERPVHRERFGRLGHAREDVKTEGRGPLAQERLRRAAFRLRDPPRVHREARRKHLRQDREPRAERGGLVEEARGAGVVGRDVFPGDFELKQGDLHRADSLPSCASDGRSSRVGRTSGRTNPALTRPPGRGYPAASCRGGADDGTQGTVGVARGARPGDGGQRRGARELPALPGAGGAERRRGLPHPVPRRVRPDGDPAPLGGVGDGALRGPVRPPLGARNPRPDGEEPLPEVHRRLRPLHEPDAGGLLLLHRELDARLRLALAEGDVQDDAADGVLPRATSASTPARSRRSRPRRRSSSS